MNEPLNPVAIEEGIVATKNLIGRMVRTVHDAEEASRSATRAYDRAYAQAYLAAEPPIPDKKYSAVLATMPERERMDIAQLAFNHAKREMDSFTTELMAWQTLAKGVNAAYNAASY